MFGGSQDIAPIVYDGITCLGGESSLNDCTDKKEYSSLYPTCRYVAGVTCLSKESCFTRMSSMIIILQCIIGINYDY